MAVHATQIDQTDNPIIHMAFDQPVRGDNWEGTWLPQCPDHPLWGDGSPCIEKWRSQKSQIINHTVHANCNGNDHQYRLNKIKHI